MAGTLLDMETLVLLETVLSKIMLILVPPVLLIIIQQKLLELMIWKVALQQNKPRNDELKLTSIPNWPMLAKKREFEEETKKKRIERTMSKINMGEQGPKSPRDAIASLEGDSSDSLKSYNSSDDKVSIAGDSQLNIIDHKLEDSSEDD